MNSAPPNSTRLEGRKLTAARIVWAVLVFGCLAMFAWGVVERIQQPVNKNCHRVECNPIEFTDDDLALLPGNGDTLVWAWIAANIFWNLTYLGAAALIVVRRSDDWIALMVSYTLIALGGVAFSSANSILLVAHPEVAGVQDVLETLGYASVLLLLLIFPDGRFVPRWTRWTVLLLVFLFTPQALPVYFIVTIFARIYRYRTVSDPLQRQQTKWVGVGLGSQLFIMGSWFFVAARYPAQDPSPERMTTLLVLLPIVVLLGSLFPISVTIAILRHRLWDIDLVINRGLVYSTVTGSLVAIYFGIVTALQFSLRWLTGQESPLAIVMSTLIIAALFNPLRQRIQAVIDRRLYRRKYDAAQTLEAFGARAQDEVDLEQISGSLIEVVDETIQPARTSLWLRDQG